VSRTVKKVRQPCHDTFESTCDGQLRTLDHNHVANAIVLTPYDVEGVNSACCKQLQTWATIVFESTCDRCHIHVVNASVLTPYDVEESIARVTDSCRRAMTMPPQFWFSFWIDATAFAFLNDTLMHRYLHTFALRGVSANTWCDGHLSTLDTTMPGYLLL
jgi:hypothetical protein